MDADYSRLKDALNSVKSALDSAINICDGMGGEESSESDTGASKPTTESGGGDKIKAAIARLRLGK